MIEGECNCGAVHFRIAAMKPDIYVCHCSICRRATGSSGIAVAIASRQDFAWTHGEAEISYWKKPGHDWHFSFCRICGSTLPDENDPATLYIPVGALKPGELELTVAHHIWVDSKASWDIIGDSGVQHPEDIDSPSLFPAGDS